ncbi:hypothetical protein SUGI_0620550 [Cryptomeria japonica]|uniref:uncharacterized protein LOC131072463 n=1 Tax=Cryptomeria japonica TaxID=3369 RepID=UPI0024149DE8|nr:uncharacterized protein LOC131072463 [Cryptomeria japonica]GLJ31025.1 hypothetical protein SUGI_0620550 [Cryptomeria japonica]
MPRPGARPYECIRRAWHGDDHLILRGTLIQEIFRVVNEIHCPTTRKKKEWQEKLPMVVLRAEDILYSKANSEAEYMDLKTLRSRLNDSINTMIRRDVSTEGGQFLEPCVEAALSLGCLPRKGSRGQRHNSRSSEGGNQKPTMASSPPAMGNSSNYKYSEEEIRLQRNGVHLSAVNPAYHFLDSQRYILASIPSPLVCPGSLLCSPSVITVPSQNGSHLFSPSLHNRSHIETLLNFNQGAIPAECCAQFYEQTYAGTIQGGGQVQLPLPQLGTRRTETGPISMPLCCPQLSTSTINAISTTRGIPSSYMMNVASIASSSGEGTSSSATSAVCFVHPDLNSQIQVPCFSSQMRCLPQTDPATEVAAVLALDEQKPNMHPPSRHLQTVTGYTPTEEISSEQALNTHDLQLRLGPPGNTNTFSTIAYKDPCSNNAWTQRAN